MKKEKINNIRVSKSIKKLIGTIVLVDSLVIGIVALGGHTPIYQDDKRINMVFETSEKVYDDHKEITVSNYYENEIEQKNRVVYYKKPYETENGRFREVETIYHNNLGPSKNVQIVPVTDIDDNETYIETIEYDVDKDHYYVTKETLHDELASDVTLLLILGCIDTGMASAGMNYIRRREEENDKKL